MLEGKIAACIFLDISKAFDCISFDIVLDKLYNYGVRGNIHKWFASYLNDRTQLVKVGQTWSSSNEKISLGVLQGSILGVLLFILYINDLPEVSAFWKYLYADDTSAIISAENATELQDKCNEEFGKVLGWFQANKLALNLKKLSLWYFLVV